ncbi:histidine kinase [Variovorax sp. J22R133]|uniref:ATP-binding protein n=1 Tax=Variovorax brevis TaxID=3053503 RepID=UPI002576197B|nr:ATP-binding protein [Variovorax sp. J22R133]MDM0111823.1 histidine kinase [Variovorax sp. J22R133]
MSLRLKINLIVVALTFVFAAAVLALEVRSMRESVNEEVVAANRVAAQLLQRTIWRYAAQGTPAMLAFLQSIGRVRSNEITLYDSDGKELYHSPPSTYKAGRDAPAWFIDLIAPPPSVQSMEFPDGKVVVRANASRAEIDAWDYVVTLALGALAMLLLVNGTVFWLVGRAVRPFGKIVHALNELQAGRFDAALPPLPGKEAGAIGSAFNRMVGELQGHIETERRAVRAEMQLSDSRELTRWIDQHIEAERHMIARELHDELGQSVTAMRSMALSVAKRVQSLDPEAARAAQVIAEESSRLYDAMHGIIPRLTPLVLDSFGLADALGDLVERTQRAHADVNIALKVELADAALGADASLALYRAAQEGITNAMRHGKAHHLQLTVLVQAGEVRLELIDDGEGLPPDGLPRGEHYGLRWLAERVQGLGGQFDIANAPSRGARLTVRLPVAGAETSTATSTTTTQGTA